MPIQIQQLMYDGFRLFCPDHPMAELAEATTNSEDGPFAMICTADVPGVPGSPGRFLTCPKSAEWPSRQHMNDDLTHRKRELQ
jgi:hypothetical protein